MTQTFDRRQESLLCGSGDRSEQYNLSLHVGALFIILVVSASACAFPLIVAKVPGLKIPLNFLFVVRHFGTGILLATAFVHLLPTAFVSLTNPCLPPFWNQTYPAMTGAIALASVFAISSIEMLLSPGRKACCARIEDAELGSEKIDSHSNEESGKRVQAVGAKEPGPLHGRIKIGRSFSNGRGFTRMIKETPPTDSIEADEQAISTFSDSALPEKSTTTPTPTSDGPFQTSEQFRKRASLQCVLLEIGILFHSVFIGMSLAVAVGQDLIILLIAITFHQLFEGLALGSRIATVPWNTSNSEKLSLRTLQPWLMALAYGCTTPLGQALGIATHNLYDPDSQTGLLVVGIMNAISAGLLTYTSLVDLLSEDFLSDESWRCLQGRRRLVACGLVFLGAFLMSLIGAWA